MSKRFLAPLGAALTVAVTFAAGAASAAVYKCAGDGAIPVYQEMPCPPGKAVRDFQIDPPDITVLPATPGAGPAAPPPADRAAQNGKAAKDPKPARLKADTAERKHLRSGMTPGEVRARIGAPDSTTGTRGGKTLRWVYEPAPGDPETLTIVTISGGLVTDVERKVVKK
jgi:hypothetical protein